MIRLWREFWAWRRAEYDRRENELRSFVRELTITKSNADAERIIDNVRSFDKRGIR